MRLAWRRVCLLVVLLVGTAGLGYASYKLYHLPVSRIKVLGTTQPDVPAAIQARVAPFLAKSFFKIDLPKVQQQLETLPWVEQASIARHWPSQLTITVKEHKPLARWASGGIITQAGAWIDVDVHGLPLVLAGPQGQQGRVWAMYRHVQRTLEPLALQVASLTLAERGAWTLTLDNGMQVFLGRDQVRTRLQRFVSVYPSTLRSLSPQIKYVDMRYTQGFALGWRA